VIKDSAGENLYSKDVDYRVDMQTGRLQRLAGGTIPVGGTVQVECTYADPSLVTPADIIGSVNAAGLRTGLKAFADSYNLFGFFPKIFIAPGFSPLNSVSVELIAAAEQMQGIAYIDAPIGTTVQQAIAGRGPSGSIN
ncbi:phage tail sheath subtilisin-like domain-containing protein, partial [Pseudomonas aeruginosa]